MTGGAIAAKFFEEDPHSISIENCVFENSTSLHNGGAIYYDAGGWEYYEGPPRIMAVRNSTFKDCESQFGGAILQLNGNLTVDNSDFMSNAAKYKGGAVYTSLTKLTITDSEFDDNSAGKQAGALYFDYGELNILNSNFTKNKVDLSGDDVASAVYLYEADANIRHSRFNSSKTSVYGVYTKRAVFSNNTYDIVLLNNTEDTIAIANIGVTLNLTNNSIVIDSLPSKFDLRDFGWVTRLRTRGKTVHAGYSATLPPWNLHCLKQQALKQTFPKTISKTTN
ncbi:hypothetical protein [Methanobrevibacter sp.]|uniref:hypothetical protein n=1 Tax=Methanobrevibacter sp. TaxID=66852 RepID=UPI00388F0C14